ncbi:hypothetical protein ACSSS7_003994 [Eimeria intestinalis]
MLALVASALLLAVVVRKQLQLGEGPPFTRPREVSKEQPTHGPEVPKKEATRTLGKSTLELTGPPEALKEKTAEPPKASKEEPKRSPYISPEVEATRHFDESATAKRSRLKVKFQEEINKLVEWIGQMPVPKEETLYRTQLQGNRFKEVLRIDGLKYIFWSEIRKLTPAYDPKEMTALLLKGVPELVEKCRSNEEEARSLQRHHVQYRFFGDWESGEVFVSVTALAAADAAALTAASRAAATAFAAAATTSRPPRPQAVEDAGAATAKAVLGGGSSLCRCFVLQPLSLMSCDPRAVLAAVGQAALKELHRVVLPTPMGFVHGGVLSRKGGAAAVFVGAPARPAAAAALADAAAVAAGGVAGVAPEQQRHSSSTTARQPHQRQQQKAATAEQQQHQEDRMPVLL